MAGNNRSNKRYHSSVGRRDFMKVPGLGALAAAGNSFGATFHDVDEMMASAQADRNLPFGVKEVDKPIPGAHVNILDTGIEPDTE